MPRNRKSDLNGTALATIEPAALPTTSRSEANKLFKQRAQELYHEARSERDERIRQFEVEHGRADRIRQFEVEHGRADRIDHTLLRDLQHLQTRFVAIAARQFKHGAETEPKVSKFTSARRHHRRA